MVDVNQHLLQHSPRSRTSIERQITSSDEKTVVDTVNYDAQAADTDGSDGGYSGGVVPAEAGDANE